MRKSERRADAVGCTTLLDCVMMQLKKILTENIKIIQIKY